MLMNNHKQYFPIVRTREDILSTINLSPRLSANFYDWAVEQRKFFLDFLMGECGTRILCDFFCKEVLNPTETPEQLEDLLSLLVQKRVTLNKENSLPNIIANEIGTGSLLGGVVRVEIDGIGPALIELTKLNEDFPFESCVSHSADIFARQCKGVREAKRELIACTQVLPIYQVFFLENSPSVFHGHKGTYIHRFRQCSDTGLEVDLLQEYIFVALDAFHEDYENKEIESPSEAWLGFFSEERTERVSIIAQAHPMLCVLYARMGRLFSDVEKIGRLYDESLRIADKGPLQALLDETQDRIEGLQAEIATKRIRIEDLEDELNRSRVLFGSLARESRVEDMKKAALNDEYRMRLYREFRL